MFNYAFTPKFRSTFSVYSFNISKRRSSLLFSFIFPNFELLTLSIIMEKILYINIVAYFQVVYTISEISHQILSHMRSKSKISIIHLRPTVS